AKAKAEPNDGTALADSHDSSIAPAAVLDSAGSAPSEGADSHSPMESGPPRHKKGRKPGKEVAMMKESDTDRMGLRPPTKPVETDEEEEAKAQAAPARSANGQAELTVNIAKLQAMSMNELNQMAKEMGIENFGTMRKHEVIFHILQKNAEQSGVLFSEGVLEVLSEGFGFLRSQSFNYLPCP